MHFIYTIKSLYVCHEIVGTFFGGGGMVSKRRLIIIVIKPKIIPLLRIIVSESLELNFIQSKL